MRRWLSVLMIACGGCLSLGGTCNKIIDDLQGQEPLSEWQELLGDFEDLLGGD